MQNLAQEPHNSVCPVCGMPVDLAIPPVIVPHASEEGDAILRIGTCSAGCRTTVVAAPEAYYDAAAGNQMAVS